MFIVPCTNHTHLIRSAIKTHKKKNISLSR